MSLDEFREDLREAVARNPDLTPDDLRDVAERLETLADRREDERKVL